MKIISFIIIVCFAITCNAQGLITQSKGQSSPTCGSHDLMVHNDQHAPGYMDISNKLMEDVQRVLRHGKATNSENVSTINVVFHVVYNNAEENIPDSVFDNQIQLLNNCFRRRNADTTNMRSDFDGLVGDSKIEFNLATRDPMGNPTTGATNTSTSIATFYRMVKERMTKY